MIDRDAAETDLSTAAVAIFRDSSPNDRTMFTALVADWGALSEAHRSIVYKVADALRSASAWRKGVAR